MEKCAADPSSSSESIGGLGMLPGLVLFQFNRGCERQETIRVAMEHILLTHVSTVLQSYAKVYVEILLDILEIQSHPLSVPQFVEILVTRAASLPNLPTLLKEFFSAPSDVKVDSQVCGVKYPITCGVQGALPDVFFLAAKYAADPVQGLLMNAQVGGDNCHRGILLGSLYGVAFGARSWNGPWIDKLHDIKDIQKEIEGFAALF